MKTTVKKFKQKTIIEEFQIPFNGDYISFQAQCDFWQEHDPIDHEFGREEGYAIEHGKMSWMYFPEYTEEECYIIEQYFVEKNDMIFLELYNKYRNSLFYGSTLLPSNLD